MKNTDTSNNTEPNKCNESDVCEQSECNLSAENLANDMMTEEQAVTANDLSKELEQATAAAEKNKDLYMRTLADLDTYRRKVAREKQELAKFALQPLIEELLPSLDHLEMAIEASKGAEECKNLIIGVEMVCNQIKKTLQNFGVEEIKVDGCDFDPNTADCVSHQPSDTVPENKVIKVNRAGYMYNGRLIRPASVIVSSGKNK